MKKNDMPSNPIRQRGASLIITLLIVVLLSLLALYGAGILVLDTRSAANDFRAREAMSAAESGVEQGYSLLTANRDNIRAVGLDANNDGDAADANESSWTNCTSSAAQCEPVRASDRTNWKYLTIRDEASNTDLGLTNQPTAGSFSLYLLTPISGDSSGLVYNIVTIGKSADTTSTAVMKQGAYFFPLILGDIGAPMAAAGNIPLGGAFSIVTNANGGGSGQALSAWTKTSIASTGSTDRCYVGEYTGSSCPSSSDLDKQVGASACDDDLCVDPVNFPADLFKFLFGVPKEQYLKVKSKATVLTDCSSLGPTSTGLIWVTGDCDFQTAVTSIGTTDNPVFLVVEGDVTMNAGDQFYGFMFLFKYPAPGTAPKLIANGAATLHGAVFANDNIDLQLTGGFVLKYDSEVLENLKKGKSGRSLGRIAGAWSDVRVE
jgi:Tfp pilus assembly protein PilX